MVPVEVHGAELVGVELAAVAADDTPAIEHRAGRVEADEGGEKKQQRADEDQRRQGQRVIQPQLEPAVDPPRGQRGQGIDLVCCRSLNHVTFPGGLPLRQRLFA